MASGRLKLNGERIREWLAKEGRKHTWLARQLCVGDSTIGRMLAGEVPKVETVTALAALMGCRMEDLLVVPEDGKQTA